MTSKVILLGTIAGNGWRDGVIQDLKTVPFMSEDEIIQMKKEFGWDYDSENECWSHR